MRDSLSGVDVRPVDHLTLALAFGSFTALFEVLFMLFRWFVLDDILWAGEVSIWMVPLYYGGVFLSIGVTGLLLAELVGPRFSLGAVAAVSAAVAALSLLFLVFYHRLFPVALYLLAAGFGIRAAWHVHLHPAASARRGRRAAVFGTLMLFVVSAGYPLSGKLRERYTFATVPAAPAGAPNILLIILDTVRAASMSLYGYPQPTTPALERWAPRGTVFDRAIATSSWTLPSHAGMFTGVWSHQLSANWLTPLGSDQRTLAEVLRDHGYRTGGFSANLLYASRESGLARGFLHYEDYRNSLRQLELSTALSQWLEDLGRASVPSRRRLDRKLAPEVTRSFLNWAREPSDRPFFAFLNYFDAHMPIHAPRAYRERLGVEAGNEGRYHAAIAYLDHHVDTVLTTLDSWGMLENTIVVLTSDHGELFGEHGIKGHGRALFDPLLHVPLIIWYPPAVPAGRRLESAVTLRDLPSTLLDLAGFAPGSLPGVSLRSSWAKSPAVTGSAVLSSVRLSRRVASKDSAKSRQMYSIYEGSLHYILNRDETEELYNLAVDPRELVNLGHRAGWNDTLKLLRQTLNEQIGRNRGRGEASARK